MTPGLCKERNLSGRHSISIAVLTENEDDVSLINSSLRDGGHAAHCHWINNPKHLGETLSAENVELLILNCDNYPDNTRQVIKQKDRFNPEVPVIALQEQADELRIQRAMKDGACDLVSMGNKDRLQAVVAEIEAAGGTAEACPLDVRDAAAVQTALGERELADGAIGSAMVYFRGLGPQAEWKVESQTFSASRPSSL